MMDFRKLREYMILGRINYAHTSVIMPLTSALATLSITEFSPAFGALPYFAGLFAVAVFFSMFGFALNDYVDVEVDRASGYLSERPLVKGSISKRGALVFVVGVALAASLLAGLITKGGPALVVFALSNVLGMAYDFFGKKFPGGQVLLAASMSTFCLFGALSLSPMITLTNLPPLVYVICLHFFLQVLHLNTVQGGVKDVDHDHAGGARTLAAALGVKVEGRNLWMPPRFVAYALSIKIVHVALLLYALNAFNLNVSHRGISTLMLMVPLLIGMLYASARYLTLGVWDRRKLFRLRHINEFCTYSLVPVLLLPIVRFEGALALVLVPVAWGLVFNSILFGGIKIMYPPTEGK